MSEELKRTHLVQSAGYWFEGARKGQRRRKMDEALNCMENAYNHVENALYASRQTEQQQVARIAELEQKLTTILEDVDYVGGLPYWQHKHFEALMTGIEIAATMGERAEKAEAQAESHAAEIERLKSQIALDSGNIERMQKAGAESEVDIERLNAENRELTNACHKHANRVKELDTLYQSLLRECREAEPNIIATRAAAKELAAALEQVFASDGSRRRFDAQELIKASKRGEQALAAFNALP